jgi:hypothetical protein
MGLPPIGLSYFKELYLTFRAHTRVWQKWRFSAPQTHLWLIKILFSASTFVVKIATFAKPETVKLSKNSLHIVQ